MPTTSEEVFHPQPTTSNKKIGTSHSGRLEAALRRNRSFYCCGKFSITKENGLLYPNVRAHSCKLIRRNVDPEESCCTESICSEASNLIEVDPDLGPDPEVNGVRREDEIILHFPNSVEPLIEKRKAMLRRSRSDHYETFFYFVAPILGK
jgi:hypothetical protein